MKYILASFVDIDSYIYIIISIVILVLSGIGSARKRKAKQTRAVQPGTTEEMTTQSDAGPGSGPRQPDVINRLEQMFSGLVEYETQPMEEMGVPNEEVTLQEEPVSKAVLPEEGVPTVEAKDDKDGKSSAYEISETDSEGERLTVNELFSNLDEIKKAVIYSEIFKRKYI